MNNINRILIDQASAAAHEMLRLQQSADAALSAFLRAHRSGPRERAFIAETAYTVLRKRRSLTAWVGPEATPRQLVLAALLRESGLSFRTLEAVLSKYDAEWLAQYKALGGDFTPVIAKLQGEIAGDPRDDEARGNLGRILLLLGKPQEA